MKIWNYLEPYKQKPNIQIGDYVSIYNGNVKDIILSISNDRFVSKLGFVYKLEHNKHYNIVFEKLIKEN